MKKILYICLMLGTTIGLSSCKKDFLDTSPTDQVDGETLFETLDGAQVALDGSYRMLYTSGWSNGNEHQNFGIMSTKLYTSLMGEDLLQDAQGSGWFYFDYRFDVRSRYTLESWRPYATWNFYYTLISNANYVIASAELIEDDPVLVDNVLAQAYALRAYAYFQLIQSYQQTYVGNESKPGVPLYTEPTTSDSEGKGRGTVEEVYTQINQDLEIAIEKFSQDKSLQRHISNIDYYVANAIKANVSLVQHKWQDAIDGATEALSKPGLAMISGDDLYSGFNNAKMKNVLWGGEIIADQSGIYASFFAHMDASADRYAKTSRKVIYNWLFDKIPSNDARKEWWIHPDESNDDVPNLKAYNQVKFRYSDKSADLGDYIFLRAEEMQLVLAEALAQNNQLTEAREALEGLMKLRDPNYEDRLDNLTVSKELQMGSIGNPTTLMDMIILQRRIELWGEAERIFDILRLKTGLDRNAPNSNHSYIPNWNTLQPDNKEFILTIPQTEFDGNPNMDANADQNPM